MNHKIDCQCHICKLTATGLSIDEIRGQVLNQQKTYLDKYGFYIHFVFDDHTSQTKVNIHTHGLPETYQHFDFQIVVPLNSKVAHSILTTLVENVKSGVVYRDGDYASKIIRNYQVKFLETIENDRKVLRVIFPDRNGNLEFEEMELGYKLQYDGIIGVSDSEDEHN